MTEEELRIEAVRRLKEIANLLRAPASHVVRGLAEAISYDLYVDPPDPKYMLIAHLVVEG